MRWCSLTHFKKQSDHSGEHRLTTTTLSSTFRYSTKPTTPSRLGSWKPGQLVSLQNFFFFVQNTQKKKIFWNGERCKNDACQQEQKLLSACVCVHRMANREREREKERVLQNYWAPRGDTEWTMTGNKRESWKWMLLPSTHLHFKQHWARTAAIISDCDHHCHCPLTATVCRVM